MGDEDVLEESGASGGGPAGVVIPGGWRAGWVESVQQPASLGGVGTGGTVTSSQHRSCKSEKQFEKTLGLTFSVDNSTVD